MKSKAAVLTGVNQPWEILEVDVRDPKENEILIRYVAAGLCHSDDASDDRRPAGRAALHRRPRGRRDRRGGRSRRHPRQVGDHVVCAFIPSCGHCRWCASGQQSICDLGATILEGCLPDGSYPFTLDGQSLGAMCMLGTFSQYATISETSAVKVDDDLPLEVAVLCGCGVPTGWGSAVNTGNAQIGDTVVVFGIGGIGANAVQGAAARRRDEHHRRRPAGLQARVRPGDGRHPLRRRRRRGDRAGQGADRAGSAPTSRSSPSTSSTRRSSSRPRRRSARAARSCSPASRIPRR